MQSLEILKKSGSLSEKRSKDCLLSELELGTDWGIIDYIFYQIHGINVLNGKKLSTPDLTYYESDEVRRKTKALQLVSDESICLAFDFGMTNNVEIYRFGWSKENRENDLAYTLEWCHWVRDFYSDAARSGHAVVVYRH